MRNSKIGYMEMAAGAAAAAVIVLGLFMPRSGQYVLADEICDVIVLWIVCFYLIAAGVRNIHRKRNDNSAYKSRRGNMIIIAAIIICISFSAWISGDIVKDITGGTDSVYLAETYVSKTQGHTGIFSCHYYLHGKDETGNTLRLEISGDDYSRLSRTDRVQVEYYLNTKRVVRCRIVP